MPVIDFMSSKQKDVIFTVEEAFYIASNSTVRSDLQRKVVDWTRMYNVYVPSRDDIIKKRKRARIASPRPQAIVESAVALAKASIIPANDNDPIIRSYAQDQDSIDGSDIVERWMNWRLRLSNIDTKIEIALRHFFSFGFVPLWPRWRYEERTRKIQLPIDIIDPSNGRPTRLGLDKAQKITQVMFEGPDFDVGNFWDYFPDPSAKEFSQECLRYVVRRKMIPYNKLAMAVKSNPDIFSESAFSKLDPKENAPLRIDSRDNDIVNYHSEQSDNTEMYANQGMVEILEYYSHDEWMMLANRKIPLYKEGKIENPLWDGEIPVIVPVRLPRTGWAWGMGLLEPLEKPYAHLNALRNHRLDYLNLTAHPPWKVRKGSVPDITQLEFLDPEDVIEMLDIKAAEKIEFPDISQSLYIEEDRLQQDMDMASGQIGNTTQAPSANVRSGIQQISLFENIQQKAGMDIGGFVASGLLPLARKYLTLGQMFLTREQTIRIEEEFDSSYPIMTPSDLVGEYNFRLASQLKTVPKTVESQQRLNLLNTLIPILQNPTGFPATVIQLLIGIYADQGFQKEQKILLDVLNEARGQQFINQRQSTLQALAGESGGGASQSVQGSRGITGANTSPENTASDAEGLLSQLLGQVEAGNGG